MTRHLRERSRNSTIPTILPTHAAISAQIRTRSKIPQIDSIEECQCHAYHAIEETSANARKRAPIAQPQLSPRFCWVILAESPERFTRKLLIRVRIINMTLPPGRTCAPEESEKRLVMTAIISVNAMLLNEFLKKHRTVQEQQIEALKAELKEQASQISKTQRPASTEQTGNADGLEQPVKAGERYHSLKSPACSCVSITLPASSQTRITALCDRLKNFAYPIALLTAVGSAYHRRPNGSTSEIRSTPRWSFRGHTP